MFTAKRKSIRQSKIKLSDLIHSHSSLLLGTMYLTGGIFFHYNKPSGRDRTAAERNYVAGSNPPQAENSAKQDSFLWNGETEI